MGKGAKTVGYAEIGKTLNFLRARSVPTRMTWEEGELPRIRRAWGERALLHVLVPILRRGREIADRVEVERAAREGDEADLEVLADWDDADSQLGVEWAQASHSPHLARVWAAVRGEIEEAIAEYDARALRRYEEYRAAILRGEAEPMSDEERALLDGGPSEDEKE